MTDDGDGLSSWGLAVIRYLKIPAGGERRWALAVKTVNRSSAILG
jgi:hypothetical protein